MQSATCQVCWKGMQASAGHGMHYSGSELRAKPCAIGCHHKLSTSCKPGPFTQLMAHLTHFRTCPTIITCDPADSGSTTHVSFRCRGAPGQQPPALWTYPEIAWDTWATVDSNVTECSDGAAQEAAGGSIASNSSTAWRLVAVDLRFQDVPGGPTSPGTLQVIDIVNGVCGPAPGAEAAAAAWLRDHPGDPPLLPAYPRGAIVPARTDLPTGERADDAVLD